MHIYAHTHPQSHALVYKYIATTRTADKKGQSTHSQDLFLSLGGREGLNRYFMATMIEWSRHQTSR